MGSRVTMTDVAREAGVSRALVSLAYRDAFGVSASTRTRILAVGERLGYVPDRAAARLASRTARTVGVHLQDLHNDVFAVMHDGVRRVLEEGGHDSVLSVGALGGERDASSLRTLEGARVGVIVAAGLLMPDAEVQSFSVRTPIVSIARDVPGVDSVCSDNLLGARLATEHLLELGHRSIALLANPPSDGYLDRRRGYEECLREVGIPPRALEVTYARADAAAAAVRLLDGDSPPTAFFAHNDQAALGVLDVLAARGLAPGRDISVVGYDNSSVSSAPGTALTTVDLHGAELGAAAARTALKRLSDPSTARHLEVSRPALVIRRTTGPVAAR